jgi:asparagine synthase (glutamine-hydrolysing)
MSRFSDRPIKTFSIGFDDDAYNELPYARQVARYLGTEHFDEIVRPDAASVLPKLVWHYGEPFGDESCIPTYYVSRLAREHVTVALSGDGGDENFGGYPRLTSYLAYKPFNSLWGFVVSKMRSLLTPHDQETANKPLLRGFWQELSFRSREVLDPMERYAHEWLVWKDGAEGLLTPDVLSATSSQRPMSSFDELWLHTQKWNSLDRLLYLELMTYLPDDLQVKVDIASMAASLEVRAPFLDYRLVELAASMPADLKFRDGQTKYLLRQIVKPLLPPSISRRSKRGFSMPIGNWLKNELRPMMEDLLLDSSNRRGIFRPELVKELVDSHLSDHFDNSRHLWLLLNFELWYCTFLDKSVIF